MQIGRNIFRDLYLCSLLQNNGPFKIIYRTDNKYAGRLLGATSCRFLITPEDAVVEERRFITQFCYSSKNDISLTGSEAPPERTSAFSLRTKEPAVD